MFLEVGNGQLSLEEQRTHFNLWALSKSPLLIGTHVLPVQGSPYSSFLQYQNDRYRYC